MAANGWSLPPSLPHSLAQVFREESGQFFCQEFPGLALAVRDVEEVGEVLGCEVPSLQEEQSPVHTTARCRPSIVVEAYVLEPVTDIPVCPVERVLCRATVLLYCLREEGRREGGERR